MYHTFPLCVPKSRQYLICRAQNRPARRIYVPSALAKEIGFEGVDAGHLDASRYGSGFGNRVTLRAYAAS
jgi:hypothetical protein